MQARECGTAHGKQRREHRQIERAARVVDVVGIAGPHDADAQTFHFRQPRGPARRGVRRRMQIGDLSRNGLEPRLENARQAQQHGVALIGCGIAAIAEHDDAGQAFAHQADELLVHA
ncbi:MAG: hypothetical protein WB772_08600, partial [Xanthobacteraceae bacterium]